MSSPTRFPDDAPQDKPNVARIYDYLLDGHHNFAIDRRAAERLLAIHPDAALAMQANRAFLRRAVEFLLARGIDQFLDIGSGIPTAGNVHEIAQQANPNARVVYVDIDPVAVAHSQAILAGNSNATAIQADARQPEAILAHPEVRRLLDLGRPLAVLLVALLHFVPDDAEADRLVRVLRDAMAPGSYLVIAHATGEGIPEDVREQLARLYAGTSNPGTVRSRAEIARLFAGLELVEPGVVYAPLWRPEGPRDRFLDEPARSLNFVGVARKP